MDRIGWLTWALAATLIGVILVANGALVVHEMAKTLEQQSHAQAPPPPWFSGLAVAIAGGALAVFAAGAAAPAYGWAKLRASYARPEARPQAEKDDEEERPLAPPGFGAGPVRTRRVGLAPLTGWTVAGLLLTAGGATLAVVALMTLQQTAGFDGRGYRQSVLWADLLRYGALPLLGLGAATTALAWGRWFPLGALVTVDDAKAAPRPATGYRWDRQT